MKIKILAFLFLLIPLSVIPQAFKTLPSGYGPEDIVIDSLGKPARLLVSCSSRRPEYPAYGEIEAIDPVRNTRIVMKRTGEPAGLVFRPHGISLTTAGELSYLYAITHNDKAGIHNIVKYQIDGDNLIFVELLESRLLVSPNALQAYPDGRVIVCNDAGERNNRMELIMRQKKGNILYYDGRGNWSIMAKGLGMPAGLAGYRDKIFVSAAIENKLYEFTLNDDVLSAKRVLAEIKGPDNIRIDNGRLLVTSHFRTMKFIKHTKSKSNPSDSMVLSVDPSTGKTTQLFRDNGKNISACSVAVILNKQLVLGQIFEPFLLITGLK